eukprot:4288716-Pleurochrysis_carterae.AAC.2
MQRVASSGDMTPMWCVAREACIARHLPPLRGVGEDPGGRVVTRHSYSPPRRVKGNVKREPSLAGGEIMASLRPK